MTPEFLLLLSACIFAIAVLYSMVGHAGASGYIAVMSLLSLVPEFIKPAALALNVLVATIAAVQFARAGHFSWPLFWPFALLAGPMAFVGGAIQLPSAVFKPLVGAVLLFSAVRLVMATVIEATPRPVPRAAALAVGAGFGLLSGLTGTGGGIFLTPLLLLMGWARAKSAAAVSALFILLNSATGLAGHLWAAGAMPVGIVPLLAAAGLGGAIGSTLGSRRLAPQALRRFLALVLLIAGVKLVMAAPALAAAPTMADCDAGFERVLHPVPTAAQTMDARAVWLDQRLLRWPGAAAPGRFRLYHSARGRIAAVVAQRVTGADGALDLAIHAGALADSASDRFRWVAAGITLAVRGADIPHLAALHRGQLVLVQEDDQGRVMGATAVQAAAALDALYAAAADVADLGVTVAPDQTAFKLWAPTAQGVWLCLHRSGSGPAVALVPLARDDATGSWAARAPNLTGGYYTYLVDVFVRGVGIVRNRVTDPYSLSLTTDSHRSWIGSLDAPALKPAGWGATPRPDRVRAATDLVIYELHVRDFSANDTTVSAAHRGKYLAFTEAASNGMRHLSALAEAGLTDVHLLPVFDFASVPEQGCTTPPPQALALGAPDATSPQAAVRAGAADDCYNWGYDPYHYTAPEGSYATDAADGATRVLEFRRMVQALHQAGLRVGMDVVYNHTTASGQKERSVLDRIAPGYYQRLNALGAVEMSTCCDNTATENLMMAKLMVDSAVVWVRDYQIDSLRFDLMGHQPRAAMAQLQRAVNQAAGHPVHLIGEGWNFGEVADGARFVQASQASLAGSGIATFSDRARDAARGGGCCDNAEHTLQRQGWLNGLHYAPNAAALKAGVGRRDELLRGADLVRAGLAGTLRDYRMTTHDGSVQALSEIRYAGQGAGYASQPGEVVNYVENHDNATLFDINVLKLPIATSREDRARVQVLGLALTAFSQGIAYYHAGIEALRSKSLDRNSFDSGDWFNRLDWTWADNFFGAGLPPEGDNKALWPAMRPLLANPAIKPTATEIRYTRDAFYDLLKIRASSTLLRLRSSADVAARLTFHNTGPAQVATVIAGHLQGRGLAGAGYAELLYVINADTRPVSLPLPALKGRSFVLHPVHRAATAADKRPAAQAHWDATTGTVQVPARTALVYVLE
jgi:pullulanase-type alpha-1,6-glucosidase